MEHMSCESHGDDSCSWQSVSRLDWCEERSNSEPLFAVDMDKRAEFCDAAYLNQNIAGPATVLQETPLHCEDF